METGRHPFYLTVKYRGGSEKGERICLSLNDTVIHLRGEMKRHRKVGKEVVECGEGRSLPLVPQTVICYVQAFYSSSQSIQQHSIVSCVSQRKGKLD